MPDLSPAQKKYLACVRREKYLIHVSRIFLFLGFLLLWEVSARQGWIDSFIFSSPSEIWRTFFKMVQDQSLFTHIGITLMETLVSFVFTVFLGIGTAVLLWCCPKLSRILEPYLVVLNSLPKSALAPLLIVWLGANIRTIIVAGMSVAIFGSVINHLPSTTFCWFPPERALARVFVPGAFTLRVSICLFHSFFSSPDFIKNAGLNFFRRGRDIFSPMDLCRKRPVPFLSSVAKEMPALIASAGFFIVTSLPSIEIFAVVSL